MSLDFNATYAGVPLLLDTAKIIRQPPPEIPHGQVDQQTSIRKQQPEIDLIDELNRLLPFIYTQDYALPTFYQNRNLGAIARPSNIGPNPNPSLSIGDYYYPTTASRWSVYRGLVTSSMVVALQSAVVPQDDDGNSQYQTAPFILYQNPLSPDNPDNDPDSYTVQTDLYLLPPRPLAEHGNQFDGLFLIVIVDERYYWSYKPLTLHVTSSTTWDSLIAQIASTLNISISYSTIPASYGQPEPDSQLWTNSENAATLFDAVATNLGRVVVRNLDGTYTLQTWSEAQNQVVTNRGPAENVVRIAGGDIFNSGTQLLAAGDLTAFRNAVVPANLQVTFPKYVIGNDPVPHYLNPRYANPRPTAWYEESYGDVYPVTVSVSSGGDLTSGLTGVSGYTHCIHSTAKSLYNTEAQTLSGLSQAFPLSGTFPLNSSGLNYLTSQIAQDYFYGQTLEALDESYPGTFVWTPEGFHDIIWRYSARTRQASTRVVRTQWNTVVREMQHGTPTISGAVSVPGVGGHSVAQTWRDQNNDVVYGANLVTVLGGTVSGRLYSGGVQEVIYNPPSFPNAYVAPNITGLAPIILNRFITDASFTSGSTTVTSVTGQANFTSDDSNLFVNATSLPFGTFLAGPTNSGQAVLSRAANTTVSGIELDIGVVWGYYANEMNWSGVSQPNAGFEYQLDEGIWNIGASGWLVGPNGEQPLLLKNLGLNTEGNVPETRYQCRLLGQDCSGVNIWSMTYPFPQQAVVIVDGLTTSNITLTDGLSITVYPCHTPYQNPAASWLYDVNNQIPSDYAISVGGTLGNNYLGKFLGTDNATGNPVYATDINPRQQFLQVTQSPSLSTTPVTTYINVEGKNVLAYQAQIVNFNNGAYGINRVQSGTVWYSPAYTAASGDTSLGYLAPAVLGPGKGMVYQGVPVAVASGGIAVYAGSQINAGLGITNIQNFTTHFGGLSASGDLLGASTLASLNYTIGNPGPSPLVVFLVPRQQAASTTIVPPAFIIGNAASGGTSPGGLVNNPRYGVYNTASGTISGAPTLFSPGVYYGQTQVDFIGSVFVGGIMCVGGGVSGMENALAQIPGFVSGGAVI